MEFVPVGTVFETPLETSEIVATPETTGDRYRIRATALEGGGPGIRGDGPHTHPGLVEVFRVVSGKMTLRLRKDFLNLGPGDEAEVPSGVVHGFVNPGPEPLVIDVDFVFTPPGPRPEADVVRFSAVLDALTRAGHVSRRSGMPSWSQMAVLLSDRFPEAAAQPGISGLLMRFLAVWGRLRGLRSEFPEYET